MGPMIFLAMLLVTAAAAPADPCSQVGTFLDDRGEASALPVVVFDWEGRELDWGDLKPRFEVASQRTLFQRGDLRIEAIQGYDQLAVVVGRRGTGPWCATASWYLYFGGKGLDVRRLQAVSAAGGSLVLVDTLGTYSSPPGASERHVELLRVDEDGAIRVHRRLDEHLGEGDQVDLHETADGAPRLLVRRVGPVDVLALDDGLAVGTRRRLPGVGALGRDAVPIIDAACAAAPRSSGGHEEPTLDDVGQVWIGTLAATGALRHPTECDAGAVLEMTFQVEEVLLDRFGGLTPGPRTVVVPTPALLAEDLLAAVGAPLAGLPTTCLDRLGLPDRPLPGRRYLVAAADPWEGEQAAAAPRRLTSEVRRAYAGITRDAGLVETFKAGFAPTDDFAVNDQGGQIEIVVTHPSTDGATGGAEQYILDKKTGKWSMGWHEHPMQIPTPVLDQTGGKK